MVNAVLITWAVFIGVFGGAILYWWFGGGYKKWLKYRSDFKKEKNKLDREDKK